jgi:hypothetical protein
MSERQRTVKRAKGHESAVSVTGRAVESERCASAAERIGWSMLRIISSPLLSPLLSLLSCAAALLPFCCCAVRFCSVGEFGWRPAKPLDGTAPHNGRQPWQSSNHAHRAGADCTVSDAHRRRVGGAERRLRPTTVPCPPPAPPHGARAPSHACPSSRNQHTLRMEPNVILLGGATCGEAAPAIASCSAAAALYDPTGRRRTFGVSLTLGDACLLVYV